MRLITNDEILNQVSGGIQTVTITPADGVSNGKEPIGLTDQEKKDISNANGGGGGV